MTPEPKSRRMTAHSEMSASMLAHYLRRIRFAHSVTALGSNYKPSPGIRVTLFNATNMGWQASATSQNYGEDLSHRARPWREGPRQSAALLDGSAV